MNEPSVAGVDHVNLCTSPERLALLGRFYADAIGLSIGPRPASSVAGLWLYARDRVVIHLSAKSRSPAAPSAAPRDDYAPGFDHIAFRASGGAGYRERLRALGVAFSESKRPTSYQILLTDPDGTRLELNFDPAEAG